MRSFLPIALLLIVLPVGAHASGYSGYIGIDSSRLIVENPIGADIEPDNLRLRLGGRVGQGVDLEAQLGLTFNSDEAYQADWAVDFASLFLKGYLPLGRYLALYGMVGGSGVSITESIDRRDFTEERYGFSYGMGIETVLTDRIDISLDYVKYLHDDLDYEEVSAVSFGLKFYY